MSAGSGGTPARRNGVQFDLLFGLNLGLNLGLHCVCSCAGLMAILLVIGVMDLRAMAAVTAAITVERLAPAGERATRAIGAVIIGAGLILIALA